MAFKEMTNIFLSASIPIPERDNKYYDTADIIAIRDAVIALTSVVLSKHKIIWGGHPSITPLIYYTMQKLKLKIQDHVKLYQSLFFEKNFPKDNNKFKNIVFTENTGEINASIEKMREQMFSENKFSAAIFIGGMDGVEKEFTMFKQFHPDALLLPVASTGAASKIIYDQFFSEKFENERLVKDYGYMSLFQKLLMEKI